MEDRSGAIWVGGFKGLSRIQAGQVTHFSRWNGLSSERVWALAEGVPGNLYVGTSGGGLNVRRGERFTAYTRQQGLPDDHIRALYMDAEGWLWIGTQTGGLSRFREGSFFNFATRGGIPARSIGPMTEDRVGRLWMVSSLGILCVSRRELNEFAAGARREVSYVTYDRNDGLATIEVGGVQPACLRARDGTLWFGTTKGAAWVNPDNLPHNPTPPPVIIEEVRVDDKPIKLPQSKRTDDRVKGFAVGSSSAKSDAESGSPTLTLLPRQRRVEFRFTGLSFTAPSKVQFRYQMENFDPEWIPSATARSASYTRLPPGNYRFRVTACNDSGVWNETGAALGVMVLPPFHQTWWFRVSVLAVAAAGVGAVFLIRVTRLKQLAHLRARIAGDLHDEIGSNLGGIILLSELTQQTKGLPAEAGSSLQEINATAQRSAAVMRDIVWFLNPDFDTPADMVSRMREFARTLLNGVECQFEVSDLSSTQRLSLEFRRAVFFSFKEILHNIMKHAGATRVRIRISMTGRQYMLRVEDNGCGFNPQAKGTGQGLRSLRQRAAEIGGAVSFTSEPGRGTAVELVARCV